VYQHHSEFSVFDWRAFSESVNLRNRVHSIQFQLSAKKRSTTYYNNYNLSYNVNTQKNQIKFPRILRNRIQKYVHLHIFIKKKKIMFEFLKNKYFFNEKPPRYILIPEKDDFLGNSQSNTPNLQFQQNKIKFNLEFNEIYWSMKIFFLSRKSFKFFLVRRNAFSIRQNAICPTKFNLVRQKPM
jgi:hypothetical protein